MLRHAHPCVKMPRVGGEMAVRYARWAAGGTEGAAAGVTAVQPLGATGPRGAARRTPARRAAPAQPVPVAVTLGRAYRAPAWRTCRADRAQLPAGVRTRRVLPRRARLLRLPGPAVRGTGHRARLLPRIAGAERHHGHHAGALRPRSAVAG